VATPTNKSFDNPKELRLPDGEYTLKLVVKNGVCSVSEENDEKSYKSKYDKLLEKVAEIGIQTYTELPQVKKDKLFVMDYLHHTHGKIRVTPSTLYKLYDKLKQEIKSYLRVEWGDNPKTKSRIDEVFAKPKMSKKDFYTSMIKQD
jgi:hypothetical protein